MLSAVIKEKDLAKTDIFTEQQQNVVNVLFALASQNGAANQLGLGLQALSRREA